ncbi:dihydrodipicolinate synthase family protein [Streptomyces sp. NPDC091217]|uniref:dihydrodipicolinate synthase family protein n=1 Tax=Streptomyces sp. NPDC091217 TaxID=3365975 RepID=UPI0037FDA187
MLALPPTPLLPDVDVLDSKSTVDTDELVRAVDQMIHDGVSMVALGGTTGECASLTWPEKVAAYAQVAATARGRVPVFAGATALGTREVVEQMRVVRALGLDGAFVGLPLWQTPTVEGAIRFFEDLARAVPDLPILLYANSFMFKFDFPLEFWQGIAQRCPTVIAAKVGFDYDRAVFEAAGGQVNFINGEGTLPKVYREMPESVTAGWATSCAMGPEPWVAALAAIERGDQATATEVFADIDAVPLPIPDFADFAKYNIQLEKARIDAAGYMRCGPARPPYTDFPDAWRRAAEENGRAWAVLRQKYTAN